jgi:hypothetical protein
MLSDSLFSDAGWLFFAIWSIVVGIFSVTAFSSDLLREPASSRSHRSSTDPTRNAASRNLQ